MSLHRDVAATILACWPLNTYRILAPYFGLNLQDYRGKVLEPLQTSTTTLLGEMEGDFRVNDLVDIHTMECRGNIILIKSRAGCKKVDDYEGEVTNAFASSIQFEIRSPDNPKKVYKVKVFKRKVIQIPGVLRRDFSDAQPIIDILLEYLSEFYNTPVRISHIGTQMRNVKTVISGKCEIILHKLGRLIQHKKQINNVMCINDVEYQTSRSSTKVTVKFARPTETNTERETTLKIHKQKINIEGGVHIEDAERICEWLSTVILEHFDYTKPEPVKTEVQAKEIEQPKEDLSDYFANPLS